MTEGLRSGRPVVLLALGSEAHRFLLTSWLRRDAALVLAESAVQACAWLREAQPTDAVVIDTHLPPRPTSAAVDEAKKPGIVAAQDVYACAGFPPSRPVLMALVPDSPCKNNDLFGVDVRLFSETLVREVAQQLLRRWRIFRHSSGVLAEVTLNEANRAGLTPLQAEALVMVAMELGYKEIALRLRISIDALRDRFDGIKKKMSNSVGVIGERIRAEAWTVSESVPGAARALRHSSGRIESAPSLAMPIRRND
jgi:hypothetical protein